MQLDGVLGWVMNQQTQQTGALQHVEMYVVPSICCPKWPWVGQKMEVPRNRKCRWCLSSLVNSPFSDIPYTPYPLFIGQSLMLIM